MEKNATAVAKDLRTMNYSERGNRAKLAVYATLYGKYDNLTEASRLIGYPASSAHLQALDIASDLHLMTVDDFYQAMKGFNVTSDQDLVLWVTGSSGIGHAAALSSKVGDLVSLLKYP